MHDDALERVGQRGVDEIAQAISCAGQRHHLRDRLEHGPKQRGASKARRPVQIVWAWLAKDAIAHSIGGAIFNVAIDFGLDAIHHDIETARIAEEVEGLRHRVDEAVDETDGSRDGALHHVAIGVGDGDELDQERNQTGTYDHAAADRRVGDEGDEAEHRVDIVVARDGLVGAKIVDEITQHAENDAVVDRGVDRMSTTVTLLR